MIEKVIVDMQEMGVELELTKQSGEWTLVPLGESIVQDNKIMVKLPEGTWYPVED